MSTKKKIFGILAVLLAVVMLPVGAFAAFSSTLLNNPTYSLNENGLRYVEQTVSEGGTQKLFYGEYNTTAQDAEYEWVIHSVRDGTQTTLTNVMNIAKDYEAKTGRKVMLATNGDYFYSTGANVESYVNDGIVITKGSFATKHCIGFDNKGNVVVGRMTEVEKRLMVVVDGQRTLFQIDKFNEEPGDNEIAIYTTAGTYTANGAAKYVCGTESTNLEMYPIWGSCRRMKANTMGDDDSFTIKSSQFAVVVKGENARFFYDNMKYGVEVDLVEIPAGDFAGCTWVLGGYDILVDNGTVNTKCHTDNDGSGKAPRTFIGFKADGTGFVCIVDGRGAGGSTGISVSKEAELAKTLGAQFALELDGGGSSTMVVRINDTLTLRNTPSDGSMRRVSNAIMLVEKVKEEEPEPEQPPATEPSQPATQPTQPTQSPTKPTAQPSQPATQPTEPNGTGSSVSGVAIIIVAAALIPVVAAVVVILVVVNHKKKRS